MAAQEKGLIFQFLVSSKKSGIYLDMEQKRQISTHWPRAKQHFLDLSHEDPKHFQFRITDHLFLDGIVCGHVVLPSDDTSNTPRKKKLLALQDINAGLGEEKASFLFVCTCKPDEEGKDVKCKAHGLYQRTQLIFENEGSVTAPGPRPLHQVLRHYGEVLTYRNNHPSAYLHRIMPHLTAIHDNKLGKVPAPLCVQMQISSKCSTHCVMCDHHLKGQEDTNELSLGEWQRVVQEMADFGVSSIILSGGEPLMRKDIVELLGFATQNRLEVGILTNGTMPLELDGAHRKLVIDAIKHHAKWVAISIDGTAIVDKSIRHPAVDQRVELLKEFVVGLQGGGPSVSATVTLQAQNITMSFIEAFRFIGHDLGIPEVNFKFSTGEQHSLAVKPDYLLSKDQVERLLNFLWNYPVDHEKDPKNNFAYMRRCFASGVFKTEDVANGAPVHSFYSKHQPRCFTPFLFSLIDSGGTVYPCCHLYRDNHGADRKSKQFRERHALGNVRAAAFGQIWNDNRYVRERQDLAKIDPLSVHFTPCGECTRHCQHNRVLSEVYSEYAEHLDKLNLLVSRLHHTGKAVWF
jgi:MoaA/NifB/PqqE/SkfB family radical SAM enzyme